MVKIEILNISLAIAASLAMSPFPKCNLHIFASGGFQSGAIYRPDFHETCVSAGSGKRWAAPLDQATPNLREHGDCWTREANVSRTQSPAPGAHAQDIFLVALPGC